jgi:hypothetical protein
MSLAKAYPSFLERVSNVGAIQKWHKDHTFLSQDGTMNSLKARQYVGWTLTLVGLIGVVLTSDPMPSGPAMVAHLSLRGQFQIERLVRMISMALAVVGGLLMVGTSFLR